jgi:hypothetical protein
VWNERFGKTKGTHEDNEGSGQRQYFPGDRHKGQEVCGQVLLLSGIMQFVLCLFISVYHHDCDFVDVGFGFD